MKTYNVTVNGVTYSVVVEEVQNGAAPAPAEPPAASGGEGKHTTPRRPPPRVGGEEGAPAAAQGLFKARVPAALLTYFTS